MTLWSGLSRGLTAAPLVCGQGGDTWKKKCLGFKRLFRTPETVCPRGGNNRSYLGRCKSKTDPRSPAEERRWRNFHLWWLSYDLQTMWEQLAIAALCQLFRVQHEMSIAGANFGATLSPFGAQTTTAKEVCRLATNWVDWVYSTRNASRYYLFLGRKCAGGRVKGSCPCRE